LTTSPYIPNSSLHLVPIWYSTRLQMIFESLFQYLTVGRVVIGGIVFILLFDLLSRLITNVKIRRIGLKAPSRGISWPFGLDVAYHGIRSARNNKVYEFFQEGINLSYLFINSMMRSTDMKYSHEKVCKSKLAIYHRVPSWYKTNHYDLR